MKVWFVNLFVFLFFLVSQQAVAQYRIIVGPDVQRAYQESVKEEVRKQLLEEKLERNHDLCYIYDEPISCKRQKYLEQKYKRDCENLRASLNKIGSKTWPDKFKEYIDQGGCGDILAFNWTRYSPKTSEEQTIFLENGESQYSKPDYLVEFWDAWWKILKIENNKVTIFKPICFADGSSCIKLTRTIVLQEDLLYDIFKATNTNDFTLEGWTLLISSNNFEFKQNKLQIKRGVWIGIAPPSLEICFEQGIGCFDIFDIKVLQNTLKRTLDMGIHY